MSEDYETWLADQWLSVSEDWMRTVDERDTLSVLLRRMARRASIYRRRTREVWRHSELTSNALKDMTARYADLMDLLDVYEAQHSFVLHELQGRLDEALAENERLRSGGDDPVIW